MRALLKTNSGRRRLLASGCALLLLVVQSLAAVHFHQDIVSRGYSHTGSPADPLCAVCLFDLHCPTQPATPVIVPHSAPVHFTIPLLAIGSTPQGPTAAPVSRGPPLPA